MITAFLSDAVSARGSGNDNSFAISGLVQNPLIIDLEKLAGFSPVKVRANEVSSDGKYHGAFLYTGVSLKSLLELSQIEKKEAEFFKRTDLAVVIKNSGGFETILTWGEIFYHNPSYAVIAFLAEPVFPQKSCTDCHKGNEYLRWLDPLKREIGLPKLVLADDIYSDRNLEQIKSIRVIEPKRIQLNRPKWKIYSKQIHIKNTDGKTYTLKDISLFDTEVVAAKQIGDGKGFHGHSICKGASLFDIINRLGIKPSVNDMLLVSAPDGYRSLLSWGELSMTPYGKGIIIADNINGKEIKEMGKFNMIIRDDLSADRWIRAVSSIELIRHKEEPRIYIIGTGSGDSDLITLNAISAISKADVFICTEDIEKRFSFYITGKPVLFDPLMTMLHYYRKKNPGLSAEESKTNVEKLRAVNIQKMKKAIGDGKNIAFLDYGDPTIYGSWTYWLTDHFSEDLFSVVPGISSFNAANAMIGKNLAARGSIILTVPQGLRNNEDMLRGVAKNGDTLAIFVGLKELPDLIPLFKKYYSDDTPVYIAYRAGYETTGYIAKTDIGNAVKTARESREQFLGLIYIGPCLTEKSPKPKKSGRDPL